MSKITNCLCEDFCVRIIKPNFECSEKQKEQCQAVVSDYPAQDETGDIAAFGYEEEENGRIHISYVRYRGWPKKLGKTLNNIIKDNTNKYKELIHIAGNDKRFYYINSIDDYALFPETEVHEGLEYANDYFEFLRNFNCRKDFENYIEHALIGGGAYYPVSYYYLLTKEGKFVYRGFLSEYNEELIKLGTDEGLKVEALWDKYSEYAFGFNWHNLNV